MSIIITAPLLLPPIPQGKAGLAPFLDDPLSPARQEFTLLEAWLSSTQALQLPLHQVEAQQQTRGREVQRLLLQAHIQRRGLGDMGPTLRVIEPTAEVRYTHRRVRQRSLKTIFGTVTIARISYSRPGGSGCICPLDEALQLPARSFSYELQKRSIRAAVQGPFQESVAGIAEITGVAIPKRSLEEVLLDAAQDFDAFYREHVRELDVGSILVAAVDGKGIPMVKPEGAKRMVRPGKGQKTNRKRMATVATVFSRRPWVRTPEEVVQSLFRTGRPAQMVPSSPPRPENKRVWASLVKGKAAVVAEVAQEMDRRDPERNKTRLALSDGERALQILIEKTLPVTLILDLLHVLEKLWKAAYVFHPEGSPEAELWVRIRTLRVLGGKVSQVVKGLRQSVTKHRLRGRKRKTLLGVAGYLYRNRTRMRYDQYLAKGWPIASGPVEGACKNLIKDRMERSGMRWTEAMAEAIVKLRAIYLSGDFDRYWSFHVERDQQRLHPPRRWSVVAK
ncbi:MAG: ISKra4 family transposase [Candidatus Sulfotelmatobacter sp.]